MRDKQIWIIVVLFTLLVILGSELAFAQEPGDTLMVLVLELPEIVVPPPETTYVPVPPVTDTIYECPEGWTCEPPPELPTSTGPPLSVSDIAAHFEGDTLVVTWPERPQPDRAGNYTNGYYIGIGTQDTVLVNDEPVIHNPYRLPLELEGNHWYCTRPFNEHGDPEGTCDNIDYFPFATAIPNDSSDYAMRIGCDWGDQRCTDGGELVNIAMTAGTTGRLIGLIEFPPDDRIFVSFQEEIVQVAQNDRGWICLLSGGDRYPFPTISWEWDSTDESIASVDNGPMLTLPVNCP